MATTEQDNVKPAASSQLVGKGLMTEAERAAFLQQARADEKAYTATVVAKDPQHYMYNPIPVTGAGDYTYADHPLSQKIAAQTRYVGDLKHQIHNGQSFSELADLRELARTTTSLMNDQAALNGYYGVAENHAATRTESIGATRVNAAATSVAAPVAKNPVPSLPSGAAVNLPPDMLDMMDPHELKAYHASMDSHVENLGQKHGPKVMAALGLMAAAETVYATPGSIPTKLNAAGAVLKEQVVGAIPGVTYTQKMLAGKYDEARFDAAGYLPLGDAVGIARSPEVQAIVDALPKNRAELEKIQLDKTQAPINRHLAEYQLALVDAKEKGDVLKGLSASSYLTELAEQKIVLEAQWKKSAEHFSAAIKDSNTNWAQLAKDSDIAPQAAIHLAAVNSRYPAGFVEKMDATLTKSLALGTPVSPEMMAITKAVQVSVTQPQVDKQTATNQEVVMAH